MIRYSIYTLTCPLDGGVKYIGLTILPDLRNRLSCHVSGTEGTYEKHIWISKCKLNKTKPKIEELDFIITDNTKDAFDLEKYWINQFKQWGFELLNGMHYSVNKRKGVSPSEYKKIQEKNYREFKKSIKQLKSNNL